MARTPKVKAQPIPTSDDIVNQLLLMDTDPQLQVYYRLKEIIEERKAQLESEKKDREETIKRIENAL